MRPGLRDELITSALSDDLSAIAQDRLIREALDPGEASSRLARHISRLFERVLNDLPEEDGPAKQAELANKLLRLLPLMNEQELKLPPEVLLGVVEEAAATLGEAPSLPERPSIPLSASDLLFNGAGQPNLGSELKLELQSAQDVDLICAFVIWSGVRILRHQLKEVVERGGRVRVITTTYMAATEPRALDALFNLGAEIRIAYDARITKLHAKSWLVHRPEPLTTAFIGSSNLSHTALHEGLEWNVRLSEDDTPHLIERIRATFDSHWEDDHFEPYDPGSSEDVERLLRALNADKDRRTGGAISFTGLEVHPYPHQRRMLERLKVERNRHDRHRNLVVAATGTGKTVVAALDYKDLVQAAGGDLSLLFVAHRERILQQSREMFRHVMRDGSFGEILGSGQEPIAGKHVFAMVASLANRVDSIDPDAFDVVIVDEFHHAAAPTYTKLLNRLEPHELVGLTATPERMDGQDITDWFGGRIAVELRLWEAIDQGFLSPFQYFGVADGTDLSELTWRGSYQTNELEKLLIDNDQRVAKTLEAIQDIVEDPSSMKGLGFCVSVAHADYMAEKFKTAGIEAESISGVTPTAERDQALSRLSNGATKVIFSVDVLGEGVDVPAVDTVLLLRPTQSATVLSQQLGRGLRKSEGKSCLTVIDLVGQQHKKFRFDRRLKGILDTSQGTVRRQVEADFPLLPAGCEINLDRVSREIILANLKEAARLGQWNSLVDDLSATPGESVQLEEFLRSTDRAVGDLYRGRRKNWTALRRAANKAAPETKGEEEDALLGAMWRLLHLDDSERADFYGSLLTRSEPPRTEEFGVREQRMLMMLQYDLWGIGRGFDSLDDAFLALWPHESVRQELAELMSLLATESDTLPKPLGLTDEIPLQVHGRYSRDEVLAAFGVGTSAKPPSVREGVKWVEEERTDLFFVTLNKSEKDYSPTTMYRDYAISPDLFHWESQSGTSERSATGQRYINQETNGDNMALFVRERSKTATTATSPYACIGLLTYVEHRGERPLGITWKLRDPMPEELFESARAVAAA